MRRLSAVLALLALSALASAQLNFGGRTGTTSTSTRTGSSSTSTSGNSGNVDIRAGLIAELLGKHPTGGNGNGKGNGGGGKLNGGGGGGGGHSGNFQQGRNFEHCCCLRRRFNQCPVADDFDDYDYDFDLDPRAGQNKGDGIGTRIVNIGGSGSSNSLDCPRGRQKCCYGRRSIASSWGNRCPILEGGGSSSGQFSQSCNGRVGRRGKQCGVRNYNPGEFPWTCLILDGDNNFVGTCAIIPGNFNNDISGGTRKVITAAHKLNVVKENDLLKVRVGEYDARGFNPPESARHQEYTVVRYSVYPKYRDRRFLNDIAILHLDKAVDLVSYDHVGAACLPPCLDMFGPGTRCWVAGWGKDKKDGAFQPIQKKVDVPIYDRRQCSNTIRDALIARRSRNADRFRLHDSELCAGGETGKDACDGDGGAPLVCQSREGNWYVEGLVTWGVDCAQTDIPGVYLRVAKFTDWINNCPNPRDPNDFRQCAVAL